MKQFIIFVSRMKTFLHKQVSKNFTPVTFFLRWCVPQKPVITLMKREMSYTENGVFDKGRW